MSTKSIDEQQLIPMSTLSPEDLLPNVVLDKERVDENSFPTKSEIEQQTFVLRLFSSSIHLLTSLHLPHFSDRSLRITFLLFITCIGVTSFTMALIVGSSVVQFKQQCPLYAFFRFKVLTTNESKWLIQIPSSEGFSSQSICDFCTFSNVFTFIYCIMTGFFFVLFNGDHRIVTTNDRCLIIPWFPLSSILGLLSLINASMITNGFLKFCSTITSNNSHISSCTQLNQLIFENYPSVSLFFVTMLVAIIAAWIQLAFFIGVVAILTIRLGSSFNWSDSKSEEKAAGKA